MHRYKQIEYKAGATIEIIKCIPRKYREGVVRGERKKKSKEEIQEANMRQAARKLTRKINANFKPGDWHVILTYQKDRRPDPETAKQVIKEFLKDLRSLYKKNGFQLKYILVTEYKRKAIHHHLVINQVRNGKETTTDMIRGLWKNWGHIQLVPLYEDGEYQRLAEYLVKETDKSFRDKGTSMKQRYTCSRNLITVEPEKRIKKAKSWKLEPKPRAGYYILPDTLYNGFDRMGYPYQRYVMVKLNPREEDWNDGPWSEVG